MRETSSEREISFYGRLIRRLLMYLLLFFFLLFLVQFRTYVVPPSHSQFLEFPPGKTILYDRFFLYHQGWIPCSPEKGKENLKVYNFVLFYAQGELLLGQILAKPGEGVIPKEQGFYVLRGGGRVFFPYSLPAVPSRSSELYLILSAKGEVVWCSLEQIAGKVVAAW